MVPSCRDAKVCSDIIASMKEKVEPLEGALKSSQDYMNGSDQERDELDKSYNLQDALQKQLTQLEEQMVPAGEMRLFVSFNSTPYTLNNWNCSAIFRIRYTCSRGI